MVASLMITMTLAMISSITIVSSQTATVSLPANLVPTVWTPVTVLLSTVPLGTASFTIFSGSSQISFQPSILSFPGIVGPLSFNVTTTSLYTGAPIVTGMIGGGYTWGVACVTNTGVKFHSVALSSSITKPWAMMGYETLIFDLNITLSSLPQTEVLGFVMCTVGSCPTSSSQTLEWTSKSPSLTIST
jgi:hypothetical protein